jgi:glycosyltransferase involved in cell wall biosynthesis
MKTMTPLVSVCIPVHNTERFVAEAVRSVLAQTLQDLEVVVVDNASTDATPRILAEFEDPRIRLFRNDVNIGAAGNFNRAISLARGRYVKLLCADDAIYPSCLEKQVAVFENDTRGAISVVGCSRDIIDGRGRRWLRRGFPGPAGTMDGRRAIAMTVRRGTNIFGEPAAILVRAEAAREAGGFDPRYSYCIDLDFWCRLLSAGDLHVLDDTLCAFRLSSQSWSLSLGHRQRAEFAGFIEDLGGRGIPLSGFDCLSGRLRAYANAILRQGFTRVVILGSRG